LKERTVTELIKKLFPERGEVMVRRPQGKFGLIATVGIPHRKGFTVVRKDIMDKALARQRANEAA
jgi:hypothetical protein